MRVRNVVGPIVMLFTACAPPADQPAVDAQADDAAIRRILDEATAAHMAGNTAAIAALFTDDAVIMVDRDTARIGKAAVTAFFDDMFTAYTSTAQISPVEMHVSGDWAFARTAVTGTLTPKVRGTPIPLDLKEIAIYRRQADGTWKVARLIGNSNRPPAARR